MVQFVEWYLLIVVFGFIPIVGVIGLAANILSRFKWRKRRK